MAPLRFPNSDVSAINSRLHTEDATSFVTASLDLGSMSIDTRMSCYTGDSAQEGPGVLNIINDITGEVPAKATLYVLSRCASPSEPTEVVSVQSGSADAQPVKTEEPGKLEKGSDVKAQGQCVIASMFTKDDFFMCAKGDGPLQLVDNAEVLAQVHAAKTAEVKYRDPTSEEIEALKSRVNREWAAKVELRGVITIGYFSVVGPALLYLHYKHRKRAQEYQDLGNSRKALQYMMHTQSTKL